MKVGDEAFAGGEGVVRNGGCSRGFPWAKERRLAQWAADGPDAMAVRRVPRNAGSKTDDLTHLSERERWALYAPWLEHEDPAIRANALICLIHQANYLLDRQVAALEQQFVERGGYTERLAAARLEHREQQRSGADTAPPCPDCGSSMVVRTARNGNNAGGQFWGCAGYPKCRGVVSME